MVGLGAGIAAQTVRRADDRAPTHAPTCEEQGLHGTPMVATGQLDPRQGRDPGRPAELASHDNQGTGEQAARLQVVEKRRKGLVQRGQEPWSLRTRPGTAMGVPGLVVADVDLDHPRTPASTSRRSEDERPAELVPAVAVEGSRITSRWMSNARARAARGQDRQGLAVVAVRASSVARACRSTLRRKVLDRPEQSVAPDPGSAPSEVSPCGQVEPRRR